MKRWKDPFPPTPVGFHDRVEQTLSGLGRAAAIKGLALVDQYADQPCLEIRLLAERMQPVPRPKQRLLDRVLAIRLPRKHRAGHAVEPAFAVSCFFCDQTDVGNLISGSSAFSKSSLKIWNFTVHVLLKLGLEDVDHYVGSFI